MRLARLTNAKVVGDQRDPMHNSASLLLLWHMTQNALPSLSYPVVKMAKVYPYLLPVLAHQPKIGLLHVAHFVVCHGQRGEYTSGAAQKSLEGFNLLCGPVTENFRKNKKRH